MRRPRRWPAIVAAVVLALALAASLWHIAAVEAYVSAGRPYDPTARRLDAAQMAANLEPWSDRFAWRLISLRGLAMLEAGDIYGACGLVEPYSPIVHGTDATFVAIYQQIVKIKTPIDSGKAHVAHGLDPYNNFSPGPSTPSTTTTP